MVGFLFFVQSLCGVKKIFFRIFGLGFWVFWFFVGIFYCGCGNILDYSAYVCVCITEYVNSICRLGHGWKRQKHAIMPTRAFAHRCWLRTSTLVLTVTSSDYR